MSEKEEFPLAKRQEALALVEECETKLARAELGLRQMSWTWRTASKPFIAATYAFLRFIKRMMEKSEDGK